MRIFDRVVNIISKKLFVRFFVSYLIVLVIPVILMGVFINGNFFNGISDYAKLIILVDEEKIWSMFGKSGAARKSFCGIVDIDGNIITSDPDSIHLPSFDYSRILKNNLEYFIFTSEGERFIAIHKSSRIIDWKYLFVIPEHVFMEKISFMRLTFIAVVGACFLLGIFLSLLLSTNNYKPVSNILHIITSNRKASDVRQETEYELITDTIKTVLSENQDLENCLKKQIRALRMNLLLKLFKSNSINIKETVQLLNFYGIKFEYTYFITVVINVNDISGFSPKNPQTDSSLARFVICNIAEEWMNEFYCVYAAETEDDKVALLINTSIQIEDSREHSVGKFLNQLKYYLKSNFSILISMGIGKSYQGIHDINKSYDEALKALNYGLFYGINLVTFYDYIEDCSSNIHYPLYKENQLAHCLKTGNHTAMDNLLNEIFNTNLVERKIPMGMVKCLVYDIIGTSLKVIEEMNIPNTEIFGNEHDILFNIVGSDTNETVVFEKIRELNKRICRFVENKKNNYNCNLRDRITEYIETRYAQKDISMTNVADHFNISHPYLSKFFKEQTGYNFTDYLNRRRITQGKKLLTEGNLSIQEIASRIGYNSANTFIRIFKKYESTTPGQYKEKQSTSSTN